MKPVVVSFFLCLSFFLYGLSGRKLHMKWCKLPQKTNLVTHTYTHTHTCSQTPALREASSLWLRQNPLWQTQEGSGPINDTHTLSFFFSQENDARCENVENPARHAIVKVEVRQRQQHVAPWRGRRTSVPRERRRVSWGELPAVESKQRDANAVVSTMPGI